MLEVVVGAGLGDVLVVGVCGEAVSASAFLDLDVIVDQSFLYVRIATSLIKR